MMFGNQPMYGNPYQMQRQQMPSYYPQQIAQPQQEGLIRVTGAEGARAYPVAPNSVVPLFDAERDVLYVKSADAGGFATIRAFSFAPLQDAPQQQTEFVTRREFEELKEAIANGKQPVRTTAEE